MQELCGTVSALHSLQDDYGLVRPVNTDKKTAYKEHTHMNAVEILLPRECKLCCMVARTPRKGNYIMYKCN